jgi:hypothetical protein
MAHPVFRAANRVDGRTSLEKRPLFRVGRILFEGILSGDSAYIGQNAEEVKTTFSSLVVTQTRVKIPANRSVRGLSHARLPELPCSTNACTDPSHRFTASEGGVANRTRAKSIVNSAGRSLKRSLGLHIAQNPQ